VESDLPTTLRADQQREVLPPNQAPKKGSALLSRPRKKQWGCPESVYCQDLLTGTQADAEGK